MFTKFPNRLRSDGISMRWPAQKSVEDAHELKERLFFSPENYNNIKTAYLHVPYCSRICSFCGFMKSCGSEDSVREYLKSLYMELNQLQKLPYIAKGNFKSLFLGGGSPSLLPADECERFFGELKATLSLDKSAEISVECAVHDMSITKIAAMAKAGVNRISFGVQSFDTETRRNLGRISDESEIVSVIKSAQDHGITVSVDLLCNLPGQSLKDFEDDLYKAINLGVAGISAYILIVMGRTPLQGKLDNGEFLPLPGLETELRQSLAAIRLTKTAGYRHETITHFSLPSDRNLYGSLRYEGADTLAIGAGAGGNIGNILYANAMAVPMYQGFVDQRNGYAVMGGLEVTAEEIPYKSAVGLLNRGFLHPGQVKGVSRSEFEKLFGKAIDQAIKMELATRSTDGVIRLTEAGYIWASNTIQSFALPILNKIKNQEKNQHGSL